MKLYRMTIEWHEYDIGARKWRVHVFYKYVAGKRNLYKAIYDCEDIEERVSKVETLRFTIPALWACLHKITIDRKRER